MSQKGNILLVANYPSDTMYAWWLMENFWTRISKAAARENRKVYLAYPRVVSLAESIRNDANIKVVELAVPWSNFTEKLSVLKFFKENCIDTIYFTDQPFLSLKYFEMRLFGIKTIVVHDHTPGDRPPSTGLKGLAKALLARLPWINVDWIYAVSKLIRHRNIATSKIPEHKCIVIQNGIPPIPDAGLDRNAIREQLGIDESDIVFISTGRANTYKRFDFVIDAAANFISTNEACPCVFLIVGDGPALEDLQKQVDHLGCEGRIRLLGYREDVSELLRASDVAIHASQGEGFSLSIVEYMAMGLPVLVPSIPSVCQAVDHAENGFVYKEGCRRQLESYIKTFSTDRNLSRRLGEAGRKKAEEEFTINRCNEEFENAISLWL